MTVVTAATHNTSARSSRNEFATKLGIVTTSSPKSAFFHALRDRPALQQTLHMVFARDGRHNRVTGEFSNKIRRLVDRVSRPRRAPSRSRVTRAERQTGD